jgi:hypothetical protein
MSALIAGTWPFIGFLLYFSPSLWVVCVVLLTSLGWLGTRVVLPLALDRFR